MYPEYKSIYMRDTCTPMFIVALFITVKVWNQPRSPTTNGYRKYGSKDQKSYVLPHMWTLDQGQTQQGDWTMST
jgi:hypothetical protein